MGHEDKGDPQPLLQRLQLVLHRLAQLQVQGTQGFIQKQHARLVHQRARQGHALALPAGKLPRLAVAIAVQLDQRQHLFRLGRPQAARDTLDHQPVGHIVAHIHMRKQRVVLKDSIHIALVGRHAARLLAKNPDFAIGGFLEAGDQPQAGRLAGPGGSQHGEEGPFRDGKVNPIDRAYGAEMARDANEFNSSGHATTRFPARAGI